MIVSIQLFAEEDLDPVRFELAADALSFGDIGADLDIEVYRE